MKTRRREDESVADPLEPIGQTFQTRTRVSAWLFALVLRANRFWLTAVLASILPALIVVIAFAGPAGVRDAITTSQHVHEVFSRLAGVIGTASAIAVSVSSLTLGRELKGVRSHKEHQDADLALRARVRKHTDRSSAPLQLAPFAATVLRGVQGCVDATRERAERAGVLDVRVEHVPLGEYLDAVDAGVTRTIRKLEGVEDRPDVFPPAMLDFEHEVTLHYARAFARADAMPEDVVDALHGLHECLEDAVVTKWYAKTLDMEWGISSMSLTILASTLPAVLVSLGMVLAFNEGTVASLGAPAAAALVAGALWIGTLPLAAFVSYLLRFVFVNRLTLPTSGFVLGPEEPGAVHVGRADSRE